VEKRLRQKGLSLHYGAGDWGGGPGQFFSVNGDKMSNWVLVAWELRLRFKVSEAGRRSGSSGQESLPFGGRSKKRR